MFRLRNDVRFHDGRRMTVRDVRYTFEHLLKNKESTYRSFLAPIQGAKELMNGESEHLKGFQVLSTHEFRFNLEEPVSFFPSLLGFVATAIIPEGSRQFEGSWREGFVGTGPYRVVRWEAGRRLELEPNPHYWREGFPKNDGLVFHFSQTAPEIATGFTSGRFSVASDLLLSDLERLRHDPEYSSRYREIPTLSTYFLLFNIHRGPLKG